MNVLTFAETGKRRLLALSRVSVRVALSIWSIKYWQLIIFILIYSVNLICYVFYLYSGMACGAYNVPLARLITETEFPSLLVYKGNMGTVR